jgi:hypothetical protein
MNDFIQWLEKHMLTCPSKAYLKIECPGCGFQRSAIALIKGHLSESFSLYPATIPIILLVVFSLLHVKLKFSFGALMIKYLYILTAIIIFISYIYKLTT